MKKYIKKITSLESLKILFEDFYKTNGHYPTSVEITKNLGVSSRTLERKFGGVVKVRELLGLEATDFTKGPARSQKASVSTSLSYLEQTRLYKKLLPIFGVYYIHEQAPYADTARQRSDFKIFHSQGVFYVDIFYASSRETMIGCIGAKIKKFDPRLIWGEIILINTNKDLDESITSIIKNRKNPLPKNISIMSESQFIEYCKALKPNQVMV